ncbi:MAG: hypothetical protein QM737_16070 [Ferruginibacter sp.]
MTFFLKYFKLFAFAPLVLNIIIGIVLNAFHDGSSYKSEWATDDGFGLTILLTVFLSFFIYITSAPFFLSNLTNLDYDRLLKLSCWLILPGFICLVVIYKELLNFIQGSDDFDRNQLLDGYILFAVVSHLIIMLLGLWVLQSKTKNSDTGNFS